MEMDSKGVHNIAALIVAYNEEEYIQQTIEQWVGLVDRVLVLISVKPWKGEPNPDNTEQIAKATGVEVIKQDWKNEEEQRNWGLARLYDYRIIMTDVDEFYTLEDREKIIDFIKNTNEICGRPEKVITYWKKDYILDPPDVHKPVIYFDPKSIKASVHRDPIEVCKRTLVEWQPIIPVTLHHMSWSKPDHKIKAKIENIDYGNNIPNNWYEEKWLKWTPGMENIRPYGSEKSKAIPYEMPQEIRKLIKYNDIK